MRAGTSEIEQGCLLLRISFTCEAPSFIRKAPDEPHRGNYTKPQGCEIKSEEVTVTVLLRPPGVSELILSQSCTDVTAHVRAPTYCCWPNFNLVLFH